VSIAGVGRLEEVRQPRSRDSTPLNPKSTEELPTAMGATHARALEVVPIEILTANAYQADLV
jgi:hypothetical protein